MRESERKLDMYGAVTTLMTMIIEMTGNDSDKKMSDNGNGIQVNTSAITTVCMTHNAIVSP